MNRFIIRFAYLEATNSLIRLNVISVVLILIKQTLIKLSALLSGNGLTLTKQNIKQNNQNMKASMVVCKHHNNNNQNNLFIDNSKKKIFELRFFTFFFFIQRFFTFGN